MDGWIVPGLVDAHCHLGLDDDGAISDEATEQQAIEDRDAGALLIRDCGSAADTSWVHDREDLPRLIRAGRHIARTRRYIRNYAHEVEPEDLAAYVAQEAQRGDGWVKLVGDWISREDGDLMPSFPPEAFAEAIRVAHEHGARVTAHCFGHEVLAGLLEAGIDCIEHGTGLHVDQVEAMAERGVALVPTVMQLDKFPGYAAAGRSKFPAYTSTMTDLFVRRRDTVMAAYEAGVPLYAGSDGGGISRHGNLAGEVIAMVSIGLPAAYALGAASWRGSRVAGLERRARRGRARRLRRLRRRPAAGPLRPAPARLRRATRTASWPEGVTGYFTTARLRRTSSVATTSPVRRSRVVRQISLLRRTCPSSPRSNRSSRASTE